MKTKVVVLAALLALPATDVSAQVEDISGRYLCIQGCKGAIGGSAFISLGANKFDFDLVNEVGEHARAWVDWMGHLWIPDWHQGATLALDGITLKFDNGIIWRRYTQWDRAMDSIPPVPPTVKAPSRRQ